MQILTRSRRRIPIKNSRRKSIICTQMHVRRFHSYQRGVRRSESQRRMKHIKCISISSNLTENEKELVKLLEEYHNIFAWNMPGLDTSMVCHALNVDSNCKPIKQVKRNFHPDKVKEEIGKLPNSLSQSSILHSWKILY